MMPALAIGGVIGAGKSTIESMPSVRTRRGRMPSVSALENSRTLQNGIDMGRDQSRNVVNASSRILELESMNGAATTRLRSAEQ
jgi:hypothetical protein